MAVFLTVTTGKLWVTISLLITSEFPKTCFLKKKKKKTFPLNSHLNYFKLKPVQICMADLTYQSDRKRHCLDYFQNC